MKKTIYKSSLFLLAVLVGVLISFTRTDLQWEEKITTQKNHSTSSPKAGIKAKKGRWEYFQRMLRDPATGEIPRGIRQKELAFAKELQEKNNSLQKTANNMDLGWKEAGPVDVGGRTRALAIDVNDPNTIIAGGVSGGIWKSTDKGATWQMKSTTSQILSVTSLAQDTRSGHTNNWYYATGEYQGSAGDMAQSHQFTGDGIYKSTDNGETWNVLSSTYSPNTTKVDSYFDFVYKISVNPNTGSVFAATHDYGIFKSTDGGTTFSRVIGGNGHHYTCDFDIHSNGTIVAVLSSTVYNDVTPQRSPGVYKSTDDGQNWENITPNTFPVNHYRNIIEIAPSNPNIAYVLSFTNEYEYVGDKKYDKVAFHKINVGNGSSEDRSANMPAFPSPFGGEERVMTQGGYNLTLAIKPDDENFVMIGATSLFRSTNGFATKPNNAKLDWIGGYHLDEVNYPNLHSDIHSFAFDPTNPNAMWWGHDGGLSYTDDIRNTSYQTLFPWENKNNGYNVTQFYMVTISDNAGDNRILGGTQDNGSPYFNWSGSSPSSSLDASFGDGAYAYLGEKFAYSSSQLGRVFRLHYDASNNLIPPFTGDESKPYKDISPSEATGQLFINPFTIDPNDEEVMYYLAGNVIWRNNQLSSVPDDYYRGTTIGWTKLDGLSVPSGFVLSTLAISHSNPTHRLYYGASDENKTPGPPKIYKLDNANTATSGASEISLPNAANGSYPHHIAVNPDNGNELIVVLSNYNIIGLYYSNNGGVSFTAVEGNLEGSENNPGPSIRGASILPYNGTTRYIVATSTGVYSTTTLNGSSTVWEQEGSSTIGNVVVNYITSRPSDGRVVAGTHGRGVFVSEGSGSSSAPKPTTNVQSLSLHAQPGESGSTSFTLSNEGGSNLSFNISVTGDLLAAPLPLNNYQVLKKTISNSNLNSKFKNVNATHIGKLGRAKSDKMQTLSKPLDITGNDVLINDDGNESQDDFGGWSEGLLMYWSNEFNLQGISFELDAINFFMRTEESYSNDIYYSVADANLSIVADGYLSLDLSPSGSWYTIPINPAISFKTNETFFISINSYSSIYYPAGLDFNAQIKNKSYYYNWYTSSWENINTISGYENAAFLIRAVGTAGGGSSNQNPVAVANVNPKQANVNDMINFDGSTSYDNDGNIVQFQWNFGDGVTSSQATVQHSYSQANTYTYTLVVTDDKGATNQTTGQVIISLASSTKVTANPSSGTIRPGGSQTITLTLDASTLSVGNYVGQVNIVTNGGNIVIPIDYAVDVKKESGLPTEYSLSQNYPNPFNPSTTIEFAIPRYDEVSLIVYDMLGREVAELVNDKLSAGNYEVQFNAASINRRISSGVYIYRLKTRNYSSTRKLVLIK